MAKTPSTDYPATGVKRGVDDSIFDTRAMAVGVLVAGLLVSVAVVWRLAAREEPAKRGEIRDFQFSLSPPDVPDFKIREVTRDIVQDRAPSDARIEPAMSDEKPDVHIARVPSAVPVASEVIQSPNAGASNPDVDLKIDTKNIESLTARREGDIPDGPEEISAVSDTVGYQMPLIAANAGPAPADIFKYDKPAPRDRPALYTMNVGPRPGRSLQGVLKAFGDQDAPSMGEAGPINVNLFGTGDFLRALGRGAGDVQSKSSVDSALHWLATHQEPDGSWDAAKHDGEKSACLADTGLACLAFMGAGNTTAKGEYGRNVLKGIESILRHQQADGLITQQGANQYTHAICTITLCEAYGRGHDERIGAAAQKAIDYCHRAVNADGGWRYKARTDISDVSVTAWFIQALKAGKLAHLKIDHAIFAQAVTFLDGVTDQGAGKDSNGAVGYTFQADQSFAGNPHPALTCAGMMIRQFNGMGPQNHLLAKGAALTRKDAPNWDRKNFYLWYYATYAMHNMGGADRIWWNQRIRDLLLEKQARGGENAGSWDPAGDKWANAGGRVYTTALGALCLEVYYRYSDALDSFGVAPDLDELFRGGQ